MKQVITAADKVNAPHVDDMGPRHTWYTKRWGDRSISLDIDGLEVRLPEMPPMHTMINYGLPEHECVFRRTTVPPTLYQMPDEKRRTFIDREWHRRRNGLWFIIKDTPIYVTGQCYFYLNYWDLEKGGLPDFRIEAVNFFLCWMQVVRDPQALGLLDIKARRLGDTEKALCIMVEHITKVKRASGGMQNKIQDDAKKNYLRLVNSFVRLPRFFRPVTDGNERPKRALHFRYPTQRNTRKRAESDDESNELITQVDPIGELGSVINYAASDPKAYDGDRLLIYHADEPGKWTRMNVLTTWAIVKLCLLESGVKVVGKALFTTTVEDFENSETLENAETLWDMSETDPDDPKKQTNSGLRRIFRGAWYSAPVDHWGFHRSEWYKKIIEDKLAELAAKGFNDEFVALRRKMPFRIEDVFTLASTECSLNPAILDRRRGELLKGIGEYGNDITQVPQRYTLIWRNGDPRTHEVEAILDPDGLWEITQMPVRPNHRKMGNWKLEPGNGAMYGIGSDPIDHVSPRAGSDFAVAVYRRLDLLVDGHLERDSQGAILMSEVHKMQTDQYVCVYTGRHEDPYECYRDALKTAIFYGAPVLFENQKPGAGNWMKTTEGGLYSRYAALETLTSLSRKRNPNISPSPGQPASAPTIADYVEALLFHVKYRNQAIYFPSILKDMRKFSPKTRGKCDLTVACGYALLMAMDNIAQLRKEAEERWSSVPLPMYN